MFRSKVVQNIKTHILCSITFFPRKSCRLRDHVEKYGRARQAADDDITWHMGFAFWVTTAMICLAKKNGYSNAPQSYICTCIASFVSK
jgi:hypothetical protein